MNIRNACIKHKFWTRNERLSIASAYRCRSRQLVCHARNVTRIYIVQDQETDSVGMKARALLDRIVVMREWAHRQPLHRIYDMYVQRTRDTARVHPREPLGIAAERRGGFTPQVRSVLGQYHVGNDTTGHAPIYVP